MEKIKELIKKNNQKIKELEWNQDYYTYAQNQEVAILIAKWENKRDKAMNERFFLQDMNEELEKIISNK